MMKEEKHKEQIKQWRLKYPKRNKECIKRWKLENSDYYKEHNKEYKLKRNYGLTLIDYNKMFTKQNGCCAICGIHQSELKKTLNIDHNHTTNINRGLLCNVCNTSLGGFKGDNGINLLIEAIKYLKKRG